jgi:hypothetical protein
MGKLPDYYPWIGRGEPTPGGGESPSYGIMASNEDERQWQFYVLQESYAGEWTKKGEKKSFHLLCFEKGEIGGLTFFFTFFSIVEFFGNTQMIARKYKTYIRRFGEERTKKKR